MLKPLILEWCREGRALALPKEGSQHPHPLDSTPCVLWEASMPCPQKAAVVTRLGGLGFAVVVQCDGWGACGGPSLLGSGVMGCRLSRAAGSSRAGSYINSPSGCRAEMERTPWPCAHCYSRLTLPPELMATPSSLKRLPYPPLTWQKVGQCCGTPRCGAVGLVGGSSVPKSLGSFGMDLFWEQGFGQGGIPRREAAACRVSLMISNEQLPLVSPLISEYQ